MPLRTATEIGAHAHGLDPKVAGLLAMTGKPSLSAFTRLPCATSHLLLMRPGPYALTAPAKHRRLRRRGQQ